MSTVLSLASTLESIARDSGERLAVTLSNELARLLSKQLYRSPLKAIEELVVNAYDADASVCRLFVPAPGDPNPKYVLVYDDGHGMDQNGLVDLWHIGRSAKREKDDLTVRFKRKQIGRFGIGKLATFALANRLTYITKALPSSQATHSRILSVSIDFREFMREMRQATLTVREITDWREVARHPHLLAASEGAGLDLHALSNQGSWTIAFLEDLKEEASKVHLGRLRRVLRTAMPLHSGFQLFLNDDPITSSKLDIPPLVKFDLSELSDIRLDNLQRLTGVVWEVRDRATADGEPQRAIYSAEFPDGIWGSVLMTGAETLTGKSDDLARSHGFFIYVRGRLINEEDALFGLDPLSYKFFNRMHAIINADDLDEYLTAPREGVEESVRTEHFRRFLTEVFYEARARAQAALRDMDDRNNRKKEHHRNFVSPTLVEYPIADVLANPAMDEGSEASGSWFYLNVPRDTNPKELAKELYAQKIEENRNRQYRYVYTDMGPQQRLVRFNPGSATFEINSAHEFVRHHFDDGRAQALLEDIITAEALLEVYLREAGVPGSTVGIVLEQRDLLLKSLARDRPYSLKAIAYDLREAADNEHELELALVAAARSLGFVATHVSGPNSPDGIARYIDYPEGERKITLEAKSSKSVPSLSAIDFATLHGHVRDTGSHGCLLVAPAYPGTSREEDARAAKSAEQQRVSCWTVSQLAEFVEKAEEKRLNAKDVLDIVLNYFAPADVEAAIKEVLATRQFHGPELYRSIMKVLSDLEESMPHSEIRRVENIHTGLLYCGYKGIPRHTVVEALHDLARASHGALVLRDDRLHVVTSLEEASRRVANLTKDIGAPRRPSQFRSE